MQKGKNMETKIRDSIKEKAANKIDFNILFVSDGDSKSDLLRGEVMLKNFAKFYRKTSNVVYNIVNSQKLKDFTVNDIEHYNVIWLNNIGSYASAGAFSNVMDQYLLTIDSEWKERLTKLLAESPDEADKYMQELREKRQDRVRIIYSLDEFVWEAPLGRAVELKKVQVIESLIDLSDELIVPTIEMHDLLRYTFKFVRDSVNIRVIDTTVSAEMYPLYKNFARSGNASMLRDKPRVLVKGLTIPMNVQEFIMANFKKMDITVSSVGEVNEHLMGLMHRKKVNHIMHWSHPHVNSSNILDTLAIERDSGFDVVIHCFDKMVLKSGSDDETKKENTKVLAKHSYMLSNGDEDILTSIAYGAIPMCQLDHVGDDEDSDDDKDEYIDLKEVSSYVFDDKTHHTFFKNVVNEVTSVAPKFNEIYGKCKNAIESRISLYPSIMGAYYEAMVGTDVIEARQQLVKEAEEKNKGK